MVTDMTTGNVTKLLLTFVAMGFSSAGQVLIARDVGSQKMDQVQRTIGTMFTFLMSISLVISFGCFFYSSSHAALAEYAGRVL